MEGNRHKAWDGVSGARVLLRFSSSHVGLATLRFPPPAPHALPAPALFHPRRAPDAPESGPGTEPPTAEPAARTRPVRGEWAGGRHRAGEGGGLTLPGRGRRPKAKREPHLHQTDPHPTPRLPAPGPESGPVPHTLQQAPPLRRHLGGTLRALPPPGGAGEKKGG